MAIINPPSFPSPNALGVQAGGVAGAIQQWAPQTMTDPFKYRTEDDRLFNMICSRMRWNEHDPYLLMPAKEPPFQKISAHRLNPDTVVVFVIQNGKAILLEDGVDLFPSDTLVTQLRLLAETK